MDIHLSQYIIQNHGFSLPLKGLSQKSLCFSEIVLKTKFAIACYEAVLDSSMNSYHMKGKKTQLKQ